MTRGVTTEHFQSIGLCRGDESDFSLAFPLPKRIFPARCVVPCKPGVEFLSFSVCLIPSFTLPRVRHEWAAAPRVAASSSSRFISHPLGGPSPTSRRASEGLGKGALLLRSGLAVLRHDRHAAVSSTS